MPEVLNTPILLIIFNRPESTKKVFNSIRNARPRKLFIAADGPRKDKIGERELCNETRKIVKNVDWECEVKTLFSDDNLGCGVGPSTAMSWFFQHVEEGIVLEDDCLPDPSFFHFCQNLLNKYRNDQTIMHIGGTNSQLGKKRNNYSYYFSKYPHIWGWATWRHAWQKFRYAFTDVNDDRLLDIFHYYHFDKKEIEYWKEHWELIKEGNRKDIWDIQWTFSCWLNHGITIVPSQNLISNIGFNEFATHTKTENPKLGNLKTESIYTIDHPKEIKINRQADKFTFNNYNLLTVSPLVKIKSIISKIVPSKVKYTIKNKWLND